jgi:hypothetical protein
VKFNFFSDPSHGWLKVPRTLLIKLGITNQITQYSYQKKEFVYLEEDQDLSLFLQTMKKSNLNFQILNMKQSNKSSKIRSYERFVA